MLDIWEDDFTAAAHMVGDQYKFLCDTEEDIVEHLNKSIPVWKGIVEELKATLEDDKIQ